MLRLAIIEDEDFIREKLKTIVNWSQLGYELKGTFKNAGEILPFLSEFDAILSDIKMPKMSGLDLAKHIYETGVNAKIVLLSAFHEFEFAKTAIKYGVSEYLCKPVDSEEITEAFLNLKKQIEAETVSIQAKRNEFYHNFILGSMAKEEVLTYAKEIEPTLDFAKEGCEVIELKIINYENYINDYWKYGKNGFSNSMANFFNQEGVFICRILICVNDTIFLMIAKDFKQAKIFLAKQIEELHNLMKLDVEIVKAETYETVCHAAQNREMFGDRNFLLKERGKLLYTMINASEPIVAVKIAESMAGLNGDFQTIMQLINQMIESAGRDAAKLKTYGVAEVEQWILEACKLMNENHTPKDDVIEKIKQYIQKNYMNNISLDDLSQMVYLNSAYLGQLFKRKMGVTFTDYLLKYRIEKAKQLLMDNRYKVYEVGEMVGYKSMKHFYKLFRNDTGYTPTEYRKRLRGE